MNMATQVQAVGRAVGKGDFPKKKAEAEQRLQNKSTILLNYNCYEVNNHQKEPNT